MICAAYRRQITVIFVLICAGAPYSRPEMTLFLSSYPRSDAAAIFAASPGRKGRTHPASEGMSGFFVMNIYHAVPTA